MPYNNLIELKHSEMHSDRSWWMFIGIFSILFMCGYLQVIANLSETMMIYANLDGYRETTFKATKVIEIRRIPRLPPDYPKNWVRSRQLIGELKLNSGITETGFIAGRHLEKIYKLENANIPNLNILAIGSSVKVLYNPSMQSGSERESLAVISADPSDHIFAFWIVILKIFVFLPWLIFCSYMWIT
jgi:hypothetical protein